MSTFMNAMQGMDALMGGFGDGLAAIARRREEREAIEQMNQAQQLNAWQDYALKLDEQNKKLVVQLALMSKNYESVKEELSAIRSGYQEYTGVLIGRIRRLDDRIQRESANSHAMAKMRQRLVEQLGQLADPGSCELLDPKKQLEMHEADWDHFMETNNVREGVPFPGAKPRA